MTHHSPAFDAATPRSAAQRDLARLFASAGLDNAALDARVLLCAALRLDHAALIRDPDLPLGGTAEIVGVYAKRRLRREPVSRILGRREFFGSTYLVTEDVLDPRADTETLVEAILEMVAARRNDALRLLDLGVGSGAILGALLTNLPAATGVGVDLSQAACAIARDNLGRVGVGRRAGVICADWMAALRGRFDVVVSNPPYVTTAAIRDLAPEVRDHDPGVALEGGDDGLDAYRRIVPGLAALLAPDACVAFEIGPGQAPEIARLLLQSGIVDIDVRCDLTGRARVVVGKGHRRSPDAKVAIPPQGSAAERYFVKGLGGRNESV